MDMMFEKASQIGLTIANIDIKADYSQEIAQAMYKAIARAWTDQNYKQRLIDDPGGTMAELGVYWPDPYQVTFYDDPSAKVGDWTTTGKGETATIRVPIPPPPAAGTILTDDLRHLQVFATTACCCCACCCTGAVSHDTWY